MNKDKVIEKQDELIIEKRKELNSIIHEVIWQYCYGKGSDDALFNYRHIDDAADEIVELYFQSELVSLKAEEGEEARESAEEIESELKKKAIKYANDNGLDYDECFAELIIMGYEFASQSQKEVIIPSDEEMENKIVELSIKAQNGQSTMYLLKEFKEWVIDQIKGK